MREGNRLVTCEGCGFTYMAPADNREHMKKHRNWERACRAYLHYLRPYPEREKEKIRQRSIIRELKEELASASEKDRMFIIGDLELAYEDLFIVYYERSVLSWIAKYGLKSKHCSFNSYMALLLGQDHWKDIIGNDEVYKNLASQYGCIHGMRNGSSYFEKSDKPLLKKAA